MNEHSTKRYLPIDHARRVAAIQQGLPFGCDAVLFTDLVDVRWLTGFTGSNGWAVVSAHDLVVGTDGRYGERARAETAASGATVIAEASRVNLHERLIESLHAASSVGLDPTSTSQAEWTATRRRSSTAADRIAGEDPASGEGRSRDRADDCCGRSC